LRQIKTAPAAVRRLDPMNTELIAHTWQALGARQPQFIEAFYERFFERFPGYRGLFPRELRAAHLEKMVQTVALLADLSEDRSDIAPRLHSLGAAHQPFALEPRDLVNFKDVFIEVLGPRLGSRWTPAAAQAWSDAFDEVLIPLMREGIERQTA
jgi:hemoglobin-like flavoprotein